MSLQPFLPATCLSIFMPLLAGAWRAACCAWCAGPQPPRAQQKGAQLSGQPAGVRRSRHGYGHGAGMGGNSRPITHKALHTIGESRR
jgi:hypothetical protein